MSLERFLKVVNGNVLLVNIQGNLVRTYYKKGDVTRADWYSQKDESCLIQLSSGKSVIINKNGGVVRTI
jgi:hypothetical protein